MNQGTVLADLLEYTQKLIKKGGGFASAHKLQAVLQSGSVRSEQETNKTGYVPWVIGGVAVISLAVIVGYLLGKKRKDHELED